MKVVDLIKHKTEALTKNNIDLKELMPPTLRAHWADFVNRAHSYQIFPWLKDNQTGEIIDNPASNEDTVLSEDAESLRLDLLTKLGQEIHLGDWVDMDQSRINDFADVTEDHQWIHTDPARAATESRFKTTVAHGFLTLSMLPKLTDSIDEQASLFPSAKMVVNIGLNKVRFIYPVKSGDRIRARSKLLKVDPIKNGLEIEREVTVEIDGIRRPACVVVSVVRLYF